MVATKHLNSERSAYLGPLAEALKRLDKGGLDPDVFAECLQAMLEGKSAGESTMAHKIAMEEEVIAVYEDVSITRSFLAQTMIYRGQLLKRHSNGGGWVPAEQDEHDESKPYVAETAYVGPHAIVYENARVCGSARVCGDAYVISGDHKTGIIDS